MFFSSSIYSLSSTNLRRVLFLILSLFLFFFFLYSFTFISADTNQELENKQQEIEQLKHELDRVRGQKQTLSSTISYLDNKIKLTQAEISQTTQQIDILERDIQELTQKIGELDLTLEQLSRVLVHRISDTYKRSRINPFIGLISSDNLNDLLNHYKYLQNSQKHDRQMLYQLETIRTDYDQQKTLKQEKQDELDAIQLKLVDQEETLEGQQQEKRYLLILTENDEKKFQEQLAQALAEKAALENALVSGVEVGPIKQGEAIGLVGNSGYPGCSTAKHLHFEVRKNNSWVDPGQYLQNKTVQDEGFIDGKTETANYGSGNWPWPIADTIRLTQHFGITPWSSRYTYSGGIHTGYDMNSTSSDIIRAPADGTLYTSTQSCGSSLINIVYIDHGDELISFYLHVQ